MIFGDTTVIASQLELDCDYGGPWLFGRFCYWINGTQVGDYNLGTSLRDVFFSMKWIAGDHDNRQCTGLCNLPGEEAFRLLDSALYGPDEIVSKALLPETPARFDITPPVDVFDGWKIFLMECEECDRILFRPLTFDVKVEVFNTPKGVFDAVIKDTYNYLDYLYHSEGS